VTTRAFLLVIVEGQNTQVRKKLASLRVLVLGTAD